MTASTIKPVEFEELPPGVDELSLERSRRLRDGYRLYNEGIGVPEPELDRLDEILDEQKAVHPELQNHGIRVGSYAGALAIEGIGGLEFSNSFHEGRIRIAACVHDIGKTEINRKTLFRSLKVPGTGHFDADPDSYDMSEIMKHPGFSWARLVKDKRMAPESAIAGGSHHRYPDWARGCRPYGVPLDLCLEVAFGDDKDAIRWGRVVSRLTTVADIFDAYEERGHEHSGDEHPTEYLFRRFSDLVPGRELDAMDVLQQEYDRLHTPEKMVLAA
jgi:hypothetical protein